MFLSLEKGLGQKKPFRPKKLYAAAGTYHTVS